MSSATLLSNKVLVPKEFNKIASKYDLATSLSQGYQTDLDTSAKRMQLKGDERVLDLCCGTGKSTAACLAFLPNGKVVGVDNSEGMLLEANQKFKKEISTGKVSFELQDAMLLDFPAESFDAVYMAYGLRNMPDYKKSVQIIHRVLKPDGKLCIHDYSLADTWWSKGYWSVLGYGFIVPFCTLLSGSSTIYTYLIKSVANFLRPNEIKKLLEENGFENTTATPLHSWRSPIQHTIIATKR